MKIIRMLPVVLACTLIAPSLRAQDKQDSEKKAEAAAQSFRSESTLHVQIVLEEFDGAKKVSSLPYMVHLMASKGEFGEPGSASLRLNERVPYATGPGGVGTQFLQTENIGTNIDCAASGGINGAYDVRVKIDQSSVYAPQATNEVSKSDESQAPRQPVIRSFTNSFSLMMRDGQTMEGTSAVDPTTGHVMKVEVTLNVVK